MADSYNDLFQKMQPFVIDSIDIITTEVRTLLKDNLYNLWYRENENSTYQRTYDMVHAITKMTKRNGKYGAIGTVYFEDSEMSTRPRDGNVWGTRTSFNGDTSYNGMSIGQWLASWMDEGQSSPYYSFDGVGYVNATMEDVCTIGKLVENKLKQMGYKTNVNMK